VVGILDQAAPFAMDMGGVVFFDEGFGHRCHSGVGIRIALFSLYHHAEEHPMGTERIDDHA
jgi:hypothetical protein